MRQFGAGDECDLFPRFGKRLVHQAEKPVDLLSKFWMDEIVRRKRRQDRNDGKRLLSVDRVLKEIEPVVGVTNLGASSIDIAVRPWVSVADFGFAGPEIYRSIVAEFNARKIEIPFRQIDVRLLNAAPSA